MPNYKSQFCRHGEWELYGYSDTLEGAHRFVDGEAPSIPTRILGWVTGSWALIWEHPTPSTPVPPQPVDFSPVVLEEVETKPEVKTVTADSSGPIDESNQSPSGVTSRKLLAELCEADPRWEFGDNAVLGRASAFYTQGDDFFGLLIDGDGSLMGGDALWWMFQQMRERWEAYPRDAKGHIPSNAETDILAPMLEQKAARLSARMMLLYFIQWRQAIQPK